MGKLGVTSDKLYGNYREYSKRLSGRFGRLKGLYRVHYMVSEALQTYEEHSPAVCRAMLVQLLKCLHQTAIDGGGWTLGFLMWPQEDPLASEPFGGEE